MTRSARTPAAVLAPLLVLAAALTGCQSKPAPVAEWNDDTRGQTNAWMLQTYFDNQIENGVVRQHTLWSHHFVDGTAALNERGQRDLAILAEHYIRYKGGILNLPRNGTPRDLYELRAQAVRDSLAAAGVSVDSVVLDTETWTDQSRQSTRAAVEVTTPSDDKPYQFHEGDDKK